MVIVYFRFVIGTGASFIVIGIDSSILFMTANNRVKGMWNEGVGGGGKDVARHGQ